MKLIKSVPKLVRPHNCLFAGIGVLIGGLVALEKIPSIEIIFAFFAAFFITGGGNSINDYADRELDAVNNPKRPIPSGEITPSNAFVTSGVLFGFGITLAAFTGEISCFLLAVLNSVLLIYYSDTLKRKGLVGNLAVGFLVGSTFLFGGLAVGEIGVVGVLALMAGFSTVGRELIKDVEDIQGDLNAGSESLPIRVGEKKALFVAIIFTVFAILFTPVPYIWGVFGKFYLGIVLVSVGIFTVGMILVGKTQRKETVGKASFLYKIAMGVGLLAFLTGSLL